LGVIVSSIVAVALFLVVTVPFTGLFFADSLLAVREEPRKADVIVVLGGENSSRVKQAVALYQGGYAPKILVSGKNEVELLGRSLVAFGVPEEAILFESASTSTFENASFSVAILERMNVKKVLLVTSWFHARRAAAAFKFNAGRIEIVSAPTESVHFTDMLEKKRLLRSVLMEYVKIFGYWLKYGISPFKDFALKSHFQSIN
jgi:uncharacterized SAM-binding protein YcdF (DUF218 family)